ncbi:MAG TPA: nitrilase [Methanocorpusculum sp.]|nr:nitrilase [Methanocorpusculum sp.]
MKISCAQVSQVFGNSSAAFSAAESFIAASDADMIIFPEQYATGWRADGFSDIDGTAVKEQWLSLAKRYQKCIVGSYSRCGTESALPENCMLICSPAGEVLSEYAKTHLFSPAGEDAHFSAGTKPVTFEFCGIRFGCAVCFDLRFPELFREYLHAGCQCVVVQAAWPAARIADWELLLRARALENRCYIVGCNCIGYDNLCGVDYCGRSMVCDWEGKVIEDAGVFEGGCEWGFDMGAIAEAVSAARKKWGL